ncbi:MAG: hypothetical protein ABH954_05840 [Candidatus Omnitrophota bacterium]
MKKTLCLMLVFLLTASLSLVGCGPKKESSSKDAIAVAKSMETLEEKANYLIGQANAFYNSKQFKDAIDAAQYVLRYLDKESESAKGLIQKAKDAITAQAQKAAEDVKKGIADFGR